MDAWKQQCMYVRMYVCMYVRTYVCMYVCTHVCIDVTYVDMFVCPHAHMHPCIRLLLLVYVCMNTCTAQALPLCPCSPSFLYVYILSQSSFGEPLPSTTAEALYTWFVKPRQT